MEPESSPALGRKETGRRLLRGYGLRRRQILELAFSSLWPWATGFALALTALITPGLSFKTARYELGAIAPVDIKAPYDFSYEDEKTTRARREEAASRVADVYDFNSRAALLARARIASAFEQGRKSLSQSKVLSAASRKELRNAVREALHVDIAESEFALLLQRQFSAELEQGFAEAVGTVLLRDIVATRERLLAAGRPISRRDELSPAGEVLLRDLPSILDLREARLLLGERIAHLTDLPPSSRRKLVELGARFVEPTLTFNFAESEKRRAQAREEVEPVYFQVKKGKVIVRAGDEIDGNVVRQLEILSEAEGRRWRLGGAIGAFVLSSLLLFCLWRLLSPARSRPAWKQQSFALVGLILVLHLALAELVFFVASAIGSEILTPPFNSVRSYYYAVPFAAVAMLVWLLENTATALLASVLFSTSLALLTGGDLHLAIFSLLSCLGAILGLFHYKQRTALIKAGLFVGTLNLLVVLGLNLLTDRYSPWSPFAFDLLCAFLGGPGVSIVVSFLLPALESLFQRTTDIKLLEVSNQNIPLLRRLALEAPGTYHHSVIVGSLGEAAAESIGANAVFCRTAALYHDIGKLKKVDYFVENQFGGVNKHDKLSPRMSALIIASHVKEGIEMAKEMNLPPEIVDVIPQHHGTKLITYFYEKAKENLDPELGGVSEAEFRYPGPKPQTKEAGIIMIADAVEAASRTLEDPSPARLKGVIRQIIDYIFLDGQLDECDLTLRDLEKISQSFLRVLMGIYHHRVSYPGFDFEKRVEPVVVQDSR